MADREVARADLEPRLGSSTLDSAPSQSLSGPRDSACCHWAPEPSKAGKAKV